jgi:hypothetical protein
MVCQVGARGMLVEVAGLMAQGYFAVGEAVKSACCHLAVGDHKKAIEVRPSAGRR